MFGRDAAAGVMLLPREAPALLSIVIPMYNEEQVLPLLREQLGQAIDELKCRVEVILVDDGSSDATYAMMNEWAAANPAIKLIALSRNFGHQIAITAGMDASAGDAVVIMDADLQDPPSLIPEMIRGYCEGYDVVYGQRTERAGETWFKRATAAVFYRVMRRLVDRRLPADAGDFRLVSRRVIEALRRVREHDRFVRGIVAWLGFAQLAMPYRRAGRAAGTTKYPLSKMLRLALDAMVSFSDLPLRLIAWSGAAVAAVSTVVLVRALWLVAGGAAAGWPEVAALVGWFGGAILFAIGVLGIYLFKVHTEVRGRPLYLVRHAMNIEEPRA
jgi:glycosyltransferase involved in cell wall biosynthesis